MLKLLFSCLLALSMLLGSTLASAQEMGTAMVAYDEGDAPRLLVANQSALLSRLGYTNLAVMAGGLKGWRDAAEYYAVNSSAQFLPSITVPTLVVHALDDPMIPAGPYRAIDWAQLESNLADGHLHALAVTASMRSSMRSRWETMKSPSKRRLSRLPGMVPTHSRVRLAASGNLPEFSSRYW